MKDNIIDFLPKLTECGSMDDVSIAGVIDKEALINISSALVEKNENYREIKENEKKQRELAKKKRIETDLLKKIEKAKEKKKLLYFNENNIELDNETLSMDEEILRLQEEPDLLFEEKNQEQQVAVDTGRDSSLEQCVENTDVFAKIFEEEITYDSSCCAEKSDIDADG